MFDVGFTEIVLIGIVALVVIGPERLPAVARTVGQWVGKLQRFVKGVKTDLASELQTGDLKKLIGDQKEQIDELRQMVSTAKKDFQSTTQSVVETTREGLKELETTVNEAREETRSVGEDVARLTDNDDAADAASSGKDKQDADGSVTSAGATSLSKSTTPAPDKMPANDQSTSTDSSSAKRTGTSDSDNQ